MQVMKKRLQSLNARVRPSSDSKDCRAKSRLAKYRGAMLYEMHYLDKLARRAV